MKFNKNEWGGWALRAIRFLLARKPALFKVHKPDLLEPISLKNQVENICQGLESDCEGAESQFMDIGQKLQDIFKNTQGLIQQIQKTVEVISGSSQESLSCTITMITQSAVEKQKQIQADIDLRLKQIHKISDHLLRLIRNCESIEKIAMFLHVVGLNINIESSRSSTTREKFWVVSEKMKKLSSGMKELSEKIKYHIQTTHDAHRVALGQIKSGLVQFKDLSAKAQQSVERAVNDVDHIMAISDKSLDSAGTYSRSISNKVGQIVMGLQFHDTMRQRISHIINAFKPVMASWTSSDSNSKRKKALDKSSASQTYPVIKLQTAQLDQINDELIGIYQTNGQAFGGILNEVANLSESLDALNVSSCKGNDSDCHAEQESFHRLKKALQSLDDVLAQSHLLSDELEAITDQVSAKTVQLNEYIEKIQRITFGTQLIALNAIIKSNHLGQEGLALEKLAQQAVQISDQTKQFVAEVENSIQLTILLGQQLTTSANNSESDNDMAVPKNANGISIKDGIAKIDLIYTNLLEKSQQITENAIQLKQAVSESQADLKFIDDMAIQYQGYLSGLRRIENQMLPLLDHTWAKDNSLMNHLEDHYTMDRERLVHSAVFDNSENNDSGMADHEQISSEAGMDECKILDHSDSDTTCPAGDGEDDLGDNVELF